MVSTTYKHTLLALILYIITDDYHASTKQVLIQQLWLTLKPNYLYENISTHVLFSLRTH